MVSASNSRNITTKLDFHRPTQGVFITTYLGSCKNYITACTDKVF